ncbi:uncharacterized protein RJT20DRAFT_78412, partial [Scheffersomyces xylosifermentans]|uniref:uncharacterized protein n=1 Tax=Scheffersomyces xylosifermentans TaxID=1304137 RepID=UPI00315DB382
SKISRSTGIHPKSAQRWIKEYVDNNLEDIPSPKPRGKAPFKNLNVEQKVHIQELVDDNASITLSEMMNSLTTSFEGLKVSYSSLQRFVKDECCLSFKLIRREAIERNS